MSVTLDLANDVLRCRREGLTVQETARQTMRPIEEIREAVRFLYVAMYKEGDEPTPPPTRTDAERRRLRPPAEEDAGTNQKGEIMSDEIYLVYAVSDESSEVLRAFRSRGPAIAFASECIAYQKHRPELIAGEPAIREWKAGHPGGPAAFYADRFEVSEMDLF